MRSVTVDDHYDVRGLGPNVIMTLALLLNDFKCDLCGLRHRETDHHWCLDHILAGRSVTLGNLRPICAKCCGRGGSHAEQEGSEP